MSVIIVVQFYSTNMYVAYVSQIFIKNSNEVEEFLLATADVNVFLTIWINQLTCFDFT